LWFKPSEIKAMDRSTIERQQILEAVNAFPEEALAELASFLDYLRYKSVTSVARLHNA